MKFEEIIDKIKLSLVEKENQELKQEIERLNDNMEEEKKTNFMEMSFALSSADLEQQLEEIKTQNIKLKGQIKSYKYLIKLLIKELKKENQND